MAKPARKNNARLRARRASFDSLSSDKQRSRKRPGSMKKDQPAGRGKTHAPKS